mgnify:CR=1 FL=1
MTSFLTLFQKLQCELGDVALPLHSEAQQPRDLILSQALHPDLSKDAAALIFKYNRCSNLLDPIALYPTLDALGSLKAQTLRSSHADIDAIRFIEDVGRLATQLLSDPTIQLLDETDEIVAKIEV